MTKRQPSHTSTAGAGRDPLRYATAYHAPVLLHAVVAGLLTDPAGVYVDGTLGGGGHTAGLLDALAPQGRVIGIDQDADALAAATQRLAAAAEAGRFEAREGNFGDLENLLADVAPVDGLLLDLGVSSYQIDTPERGFSFRGEGKLDMRMSQEDGLAAAAIVNGWDERELRHILRAFGEEPRARKIAAAIVAARPLETTTGLADVVRAAVPVPDEAKSVARVFQALRIAVNDELVVLERALKAGVAVLKPGGRMAVISYHSLEDRRAKRFFRHGNLAGEPRRDFYGNPLTPWRLITRKPIEADAAEVAANPRARSARLRIAERLPDAPATTP